MFKEIFLEASTEDEFYDWHENSANWDKHRKYMDSMYSLVKSRASKGFKPGEIFHDLKITLSDGEISQIMNDVRKMQSGKIIKFGVK